MSLREPQCLNCECPRSAHYSEHESSGHDVNQTRERRYFACLNLRCDCEKYQQPPRVIR